MSNELNDEFIPLEKICLVSKKNSASVAITEEKLVKVPPPFVKNDSYHKSLGIIIEPEIDNDNDICDNDDDDVILNDNPPPLVVIDDDNDEEINENSIKCNFDDESRTLEVDPEEIAKNFQRFLESNDDTLNSDEYSNIEPEVILAENDSLELVVDINPDVGDSKKPYKCSLCGREVVSRYNLKRHMMIHTGEKPHECDICHKRFREYSDVRKHKRIHSAKEFNCNVCFRNLSMPNDPKKCFFCETEHNNKLKTKNDDMMEILSTQSNGSDVDGDDDESKLNKLDTRKRKTYVCTFCDKIFGSSHNLKRHVMIHTGEKPFKCTECDKQFREMNCLQKHFRIHTGEKPYKCDICDKLFQDSSNLNKHKQIHSNQQHECSICGKKFNYSSNLFKHFRIHTGEKPYKCHICSKNFRSKHHMQNHVLTHFKR